MSHPLNFAATSIFFNWAAVLWRNVGTTSASSQSKEIAVQRAWRFLREER